MTWLITAAPEHLVQFLFDQRAAVGCRQVVLVAAAEPDGRRLGERLDERWVVGLLAVAGVQQGERRQVVFLPRLQRFLAALGAGGGDDDEAGLVAAAELDELVADVVRHAAAADDDESARDFAARLGDRRRRRPGQQADC